MRYNHNEQPNKQLETDKSVEGEGRHQIHLYSREVTEMPYVDVFNGNRRPKAKWILTLFLTSSTLFSQIAVVSGFESVSSSVLLSLFFVIVLISLVLGSRLITNDNSHSRRQATVPLFPHLTYFTLFILVFVLATTKFFTFALFLIWMFIGLVLYFMYGYWNSSERFNTTTGINHDEDSDMYRAIIGNDYAIQFE
ncbi:unnamed protein product [Nippostrongylus brasiliensis]|uniref:AA_permease_C domain-containing protein n=1 Tax=Nippostrongylus brasiliensis TaxID=27835 RepID=A0A0N4YI06_NIPBR|nr:unnamed protein product [Nippostrongylus brasiliensis]